MYKTKTEGTLSDVVISFLWVWQFVRFFVIRLTLENSMLYGQYLISDNLCEGS